MSEVQVTELRIRDSDIMLRIIIRYTGYTQRLGNLCFAELRNNSLGNSLDKMHGMLEQWFLAGGGFTFQGTVGNTWRHFQLSTTGG